MIYRGRNPQLAEEFHQHGKEVERAYKSIFGDRHRTIGTMEADLLVPEAFFESEEELSRYGRVDVRMAAIDNDNLFVPAFSDRLYAMDVDTDGTVRAKRGAVVDSTCGILMTDTGVAEHTKAHDSILPPYLAAYVHEYNHFLNYALPDIPLAAVSAILSAQFTRRNIPIRFDSREAITEMMGALRDDYMMTLFQLLMNITLIDEGIANGLETRVFRRLGYNTAPFEKHNNESENPHYPAILQLSDQSLVAYVHQWYRSPQAIPFTKNFFRSLENIRFRKMRINLF